MELSIKYVNGIRNLTVNKECSILELKNEIENMCGALPEEQALYFNNTQLNDDNKLLSSYGISSECEIFVGINLSEITVIIKYNNQTKQINVKRNETGDDLKKKIHKILNKPCSEQLLIYKDMSIENDQKLSVYGLTEKSVILLLDRVTEERKRLIVRMNEREPFGIDYVNEIPVADVLERIKEKCSNKDMEYSILLNGEALSSTDICGKPEHSVFQSILVQSSITTQNSKCKMNIVIKMINGHDVTLSLSNDAIVEQLKIKIKEYFGVSLLQQKLIFNGAILDENKEKLSTFGLLNGSYVALSLYPSQFELQIHVRDDRILKLIVKPSDNLMSVKKELQKLVPIHIDEQLLLHQGTELTENRPLSDYNILDKCCLKLITKLRDKVDFIINRLNGNRFSMTISSNRTIYDIKSMLNDKLGILPAEQRLIMNCRILEDYQTVSECFTNDNIVINLLCRKKTAFEIFVTNFYGDRFPLEVDKNEKVIDIKRKIEISRGWEIKTQKFIFQGRILNNEEIIDDCGVEWNSVINVVILKR